MFNPKSLKSRAIMIFSIMVVTGMLIIPTGIVAASSATVANTVRPSQNNSQTGTATGGKIDQDASNKAKVSQGNAQTGTATGGQVDQDASNKAKVSPG